MKRLKIGSNLWLQVVDRTYNFNRVLFPVLLIHTSEYGPICSTAYPRAKNEAVLEDSWELKLLILDHDRNGLCLLCNFAGFHYF